MLVQEHKTSLHHNERKANRNRRGQTVQAFVAAGKTIHRDSHSKYILIQGMAPELHYLLVSSGPRHWDNDKWEIHRSDKAELLDMALKHKQLWSRFHPLYIPAIVNSIECLRYHKN